MQDWLIIGTLVVLAAAGVLWRRAAGAQAHAEARLAEAERLRREAVAAAGWQTALLRALQQAQVDAIMVLSADGAVLELNSAAQALFGPQAAPGRTVMLATRSVELDELVTHCLAGGADCDRQVLVGRGHAPYRARAVAARSAPGGGAATGVVLVLQDLSELQRLGRARRDFVANISHELRTPITSIRLLVDTLRGTAQMAPEVRDELLEKISVETEALAQLSQELLDLAQIESGQALVRLVPTPVSDLVDSVIARFAPQAERKRQRIQVDVAPGLKALADPDQVTRALGNLVHNAIKFAPPEGEIRVTASLGEGDVLLQVHDTGPGISPDDLPRVFERFYRGDRARAGGGTGLGLAIAKHVVEAHGGRLWVESEGRPGRGASFYFTLPAAEAAKS